MKKVNQSLQCEPSSQDLHPLPPANLPESEYALWHRVCGHLLSKGYSLDLAYHQIFNYCFQNFVYNYNAGQVSISETPSVETFSNDNRGQCQNYKNVNEANKQMAAFEKSWGFNPLYSAKIEYPEKPEEFDDEFGL